MRLINADKIEYYPVDRDGKRIGEMVWKPHIDSIETFDLEAHDKQVVDVFKKKMKGYLRRHKTTGISDYDVDCIAEISIKEILEG